MRVFLAGLLSLIPLQACSQPPAGEDFVARAEDGAEIHATYHAPAEASGPAPVAILLPMYAHDRSSWAPLIGPLTQAGFAAVAVDLRGHGESTRRGDQTLDHRSARTGGENLFLEMWMDVDAVVAWLADNKSAEVDLDRLALVGASVGCSVALDWSTRDARAKVLVLLSPGTDYLGTDSLADIARTQAQRIYMIAPETEADRPAALADAARAAGVSAAINVTIQEDHDEHGTDMLGAVEGLEAWIITLLRQGMASTTPPGRAAPLAALSHRGTAP